ncbi:MAG: hypothetical protein ACRC5M_05805 [Anaeroplasmataceae bacterium]
MMNILRLEKQKNIMEMFENIFLKNKISHAYIFNATKGVGALEVAYYLAALHYCDNYGCLECDTCKNIFNGKHPNVLFIDQDNLVIKKEVVTEIQNEFSKTSLVKGKRFYIINNAENINVQASNSLLKFIEEPTNDNLIAILITNDIVKLLPTIISRCQIVNFNGITRDVFLEEFNQKVSFEDDCFISLITLDIDYAIDLINNDNNVLLIEHAKNYFFKTNRFEFISEIKQVSKIIKNKDDLVIYLELLIGIHSSIINKFDCFKNSNKTLNNYKDKIGQKNILHNLELIINIRDSLDYNVNIKTALLELITNIEL